MQLFHAQPGNREHPQILAVLADLASALVPKSTRRAAAAATAVPAYEGHAWCDALERQVIAGAAHDQRIRL